MDNIKINSDIVLPNEKIRNIVQEIIKDEGFVSYNINITAGSNVGDNFLSEIYRVIVTGEKSKHGINEKLKLICKLSPTNVLRREKFRIYEIFKRELLFYNEILPLMTKLQEEQGIVARKDNFRYVPHVYATNDEELKEFLIFEDLREDGYTMFNRFKKIDFAHSVLVMSALGNFHALSFALRDKYPETFEKYTKLGDPLWKKDVNDFSLQRRIRNALASINKKEVDLVKKMEAVTNVYCELYNHLVDGSKNEPYSVLTHGDTWTNNMMFRYENGIACDIKLLDWQLCKYASPVLDVLHFIFVSTENPFRADNYEKLLKIYHKSLSKFLIRLQCDPEKLFPYSAFQDQVRKFGIYGFVAAIYFEEIVMTHPDDLIGIDEYIEKMNDKEKLEEELSTGFNKVRDVFNARMSDIVRDIDQLGYFEIFKTLKLE